MQKSFANETTCSYPVNATEKLVPPPGFSNNSSNKSKEVTAYTRRWYVLIMYCCLAMMQSLIWNTWGPIQATARAVYDWEDYVIDLIAAWGSIAFCVTMMPFAWLMDVKGLRIAVLVAAGLQLVGAALRCISTDNSTVITDLIHFGQMLNGLAGPVGMAAPALLSSTWFPPYQRTTATAISAMASYIGVAFSFLICPAFVDDVQNSNIPKVNDNYVLNATERDKYQVQINNLLYFEAGVMAGVFLGVLVYYPAKPPRPPSLSAATGRVDFKSGLKTLFKNRNYLLLLVLYGASNGVYGAWVAVLDQNLSDFSIHVGQNFAGWLGFAAVISGSFSGVLFSLFADHSSGHLKLLLIVFMALSFCTILLICYVFTKVIPFNEILVYVLFSLSGFFMNGAIPFFYELGVEITYPVAEGVTTGVTTFSNNFLASIFLIVPLGHLGTKWMIWATVGTCAASTVFLLFVKEIYNRSVADRRSSFSSRTVSS